MSQLVYIVPLQIPSHSSLFKKVLFHVGNGNHIKGKKKNIFPPPPLGEKIVLLVYITFSFTLTLFLDDSAAKTHGATWNGTANDG